MEPTVAVSAVSAAVTSTVKLTEKVFEIRAVDKQASSLLDTIDQVNGQLDLAQDLRRQKSTLLTVVEKKLMDSTFQSTERTLAQVAKLVEPCRAAMETSNGGVGLGTRPMFVLRDSPNIQTSLTRLGLASQTLSTSLVLLCSKKFPAQDPSFLGNKRPSSYSESQFLTASRARNLLRKASIDIASDDSRDYEPPLHSKPLAGIPECLEDPPAWLESSMAGSRKAAFSKDELFFESADDTKPRLTSNGYGQFIAYRPGSSSASTASLQSSMSVPSSLQPGWPASSPPSLEYGFDRRNISAWHDDSRRRRYDSVAAETLNKSSWNLPLAPRRSPVPRSASSPASISSSDISSRSSTYDEQHSIVENQQHRNLFELEDTSVNFSKRIYAVPCTISDKVSIPFFSKLVKLEEQSDAVVKTQVEDFNISEPEVADTGSASELVAAEDLTLPAVDFLQELSCHARDWDLHHRTRRPARCSRLSSRTTLYWRKTTYHRCSQDFQSEIWTVLVGPESIRPATPTCLSSRTIELVYTKSKFRRATLKNWYLGSQRTESSCHRLRLVGRHLHSPPVQNRQQFRIAESQRLQHCRPAGCPLSG
jgi:hypothetical protein